MESKVLTLPQAAQLPWSHLGLDCDQILVSPLPMRHDVVESTVGQVMRAPRKLQAGMLAALKLAWELTNSLFTTLATCVLAAIVVWAMSAGSPPPASRSEQRDEYNSHDCGWLSSAQWSSNSGVSGKPARTDSAGLGYCVSRPSHLDFSSIASKL